jgi:hypothetical protein
VYFLTGSQLWFLNESTGKWSGPWTVPGHPAGVTSLPNGNAAFASSGNIDLHGGTTPAQAAVFNPKTGKVQHSNLLAGYTIHGGTVAGDGSVMAVTTWTGWLSGQTTPHLQQAVWASPDGLNFSLRSTIPGYGALWFISKATDGTNRLFTGGENANGPWQSSDNGRTWQSLGLSSSLGFSGNIWGVTGLPDGTLLVQKRLKTSTGQYPLVRGTPGGPWLPSSTGLPGYLDVYTLIQTSTGALVAGMANQSGTQGGSYVSYDNGNTWSSLTSNGAPAVQTKVITATSTHVYIWPSGSAPLVATL